ncbi:metallophosphoesterase [Petrotoga sp. 9PWA.NaAc.5.4]|uniref:metallophosphoesterase n=1 Tax=Petrotoga sp. 9PWA.NaAc.5.4 TaxID=1434328 RepID=UPI000CAFC6DE|nr:metallophosphoesterase [Petrotoga sp. 9PWA.NaAc.5.4]PNR96773.1 metallophosphoesterase [Petrotoga sp. 9PWA.NaAc.5.4]
MKVYLSDLHIGLGNESDDFIYDDRLIKLLDELQKEKTEMYIVGDFLELTNLINDGYMANTANEYANNFDVSLIDEIFKSHEKLINTFKNFSKKNRVYYIVGNHDYYVLLNHKIKEKIKENFENCEILPFYYDEELKLFVIHGNQFDPVNRLNQDEEGSLIPSFSEYMNKYINYNFANIAIKILPKELFSDYQNIYPQLDVFKWLDYIKNKYELSYDLKNQWIETFTQMIKTDQVKKWMKINYPGINVLSNIFVNRVGGIKLGESIVRIGMFFRSLRNSNSLLMKAQKLLDENFFIPKNYLLGFYDKDISFSEGDINSMVMGHNHRASFNIISNGAGKKFYANTGTWKFMVNRNFGINKNEFVKRKLISYLVITEKNKKIIAKLIKEEAY